MHGLRHPRILRLPGLLQAQPSRHSERIHTIVCENARSESRQRLRSDNGRRHSRGCRTCHPSNYVYSAGQNGILWRKKPAVTVRNVSNSKPNNSSSSSKP